MILQNDFYAIESSSIQQGVHTYTIHLNPLHHIFDGHFPGNPVTPGVVQMEIVKELLSTSLEKPMSLDTMGTCKFLAILNPNETPDVTVTLNVSNDDEGNTKVSASIVEASTPLSPQETTEDNTPTSFFKMNAVYK
jgi:3-hydroxyacyl-[acyl-carrier-protein] dehydratase